MPAASVAPRSITDSKPSTFAPRLAVAGIVAFVATAGLVVLQLVAGRLLAPFVGWSVEAWAVEIAAALAGVTLGNAAGGRADKRPTAGTLAAWLALGAVAAVWVVLLPLLLNGTDVHTRLPLGPRVFALAFAFCFPVGFALGVLTPLAIRTGRVGWVAFALAVSGGLAGYTLASFALLPAFTLNQIAVGTAAALAVAAAGVMAAQLGPSDEIERRPHPSLMPSEPTPDPLRLPPAIAWGATGAAAGALLGTAGALATVLIPAAVAVLAAVAVAGWKRGKGVYALCVAGGMLAGGAVVLMNADTRTPTAEIGPSEPQERFAVEAISAARDAHPDGQRVLLIGGGGGMRTTVPTAEVEGVSNGRLFVTERAEKGAYHVVALDATTNPTWPLLTQECNEAVKATLTADGRYLLTVTDDVADGRLWKAVYHTLKQTFPHIAVVLPKGVFDPQRPENLGRSVIVLHAANRPLEPDRWAEMMYRQTGHGGGMFVLPADVVEKLLTRDKPILLTDQYAPVDGLRSYRDR